eukprot:c16486_g1_i2 orf=27-347(-)
MAAANLSRPLFTCQLRGHGFLSRKRCRILSLRAFNGDSSISPEERAKKALKELDDQLSEVNQTSSPSSPRPLPDMKSHQSKVTTLNRDATLHRTVTTLQSKDVSIH